MSSCPQVSSSSTPNFQRIFEKALKEYKKKTGNDLTAHPLANQIKGCKSPEAILTVLEGKANELNQSRSSDERLTKWLNPTVNILTALSATLGQGAGLIFPPTTIIFSGIGILLVAAKGTVAHRDVLITLFGRIESFFERLKIYTKVPPSPAIMDELAKIMAEVLLILGIATKGIKEGRIKIFLKNVAGMNDLEDALQRFGELEQREILTGIAQLSCDATVIKDDANETKADVKEAKAMVIGIVGKMDAREWKEMLRTLKDWLTPPDPSTNYAIGLRDLHEETATWFLGGRVFQEWHLAGSLLWIHGKPGSGKSILCSAIIQRILSLSDGGRASVAYFYFDFRDDNKKHRHNLLASLLVQFAAQSIPCCDILSRVYSAHGKGTQPPSDEVLINCLVDMLRFSATTLHPIYVIVDALDECPNTSGVRSPRERVLSLIKDLVNLCLPDLHVCVTSRPEFDIRKRLEPLTSRRVSLHDQTGHKEDIAKYIRSEVDVVANDNRWREDDKKLVIETLSEKADGMFRWVFCQLEMLRLCFRSRVRHFLHELPDSLDETYERILKGIHKTKRGNVQRLLQCLAVAVEPLCVDDVVAILTFDPDAIEGEVSTLDEDSRSEDREQELLSACPGLITIVVGSFGREVVQFSHFSVKEFLTSDRLATSSQDISRYHILPEAAHTTLVQASLGVLLRLDDPVNTWGAESIPLAVYAARKWVSHAQVGNVSSYIIHTMKTLFDSDKPHFANWLQIYDHRSWKNRNPATPLYYSALYGFYDLVEYLIKKHPHHINAHGGRHIFPLVATLHGGHIRVAELLFQHGADVSIQGIRGRVLLHEVTEWSNELAAGATQFLLEHHADANARDEDNSTPLHLASLFLKFKSMRTLLDHGADVNAEDKHDRTPLHRVQTNIGNRKRLFRVAQAAQLLVDRGADVNKPDKDHETPLHIASRKVLLEVAWIILKGGADSNVENREGKISFQLVQENLRAEMEQRPLDYLVRRKRRAECVALMGLLYRY